MTSPTIAVLRGQDQRAGRFPTCCVLTGAQTQTAIRCYSCKWRHADIAQLVLGYVLADQLSRSPLKVSLPVTDTAWRAWRRRLGTAVGTTVAGVAMLTVGIVRTYDQVIAFGVTLTVIGIGLRIWWTLRWWVGVRYRPEQDVLLVSRCSPTFENEARRMFTSGITGRKLTS